MVISLVIEANAIRPILVSVYRAIDYSIKDSLGSRDGPDAEDWVLELDVLQSLVAGWLSRHNDFQNPAVAGMVLEQLQAFENSTVPPHRAQQLAGILSELRLLCNYIVNEGR